MENNFEFLAPREERYNENGYSTKRSTYMNKIMKTLLLFIHFIWSSVILPEFAPPFAQQTVFGMRLDVWWRFLPQPFRCARRIQIVAHICRRSDCCRVLPAQTFSFPNLTFWLKVCFLHYIYFYWIIFRIFKKQKFINSDDFRSPNEMWLIENRVGRLNAVFAFEISQAIKLRTVHAHRRFGHTKSIRDENEKKKMNLLSILLRTKFSHRFDYVSFHSAYFSILISPLILVVVFLLSFPDSRKFFIFFFFDKLNGRKWLAQLHLHPNACGSTNANMLRPNANFTAR